MAIPSRTVALSRYFAATRLNASRGRPKISSADTSTLTIAKPYGAGRVEPARLAVGTADFTGSRLDKIFTTTKATEPRYT